MSETRESVAKARAAVHSDPYACRPRTCVVRYIDGDRALSSSHLGGRQGWARHAEGGTLRVVQAYVGVTDAEWARHLAAAGADEVNFWRPAGDRALCALSVGEPFFFKTHHPDNRVVGGGFFSGFASP